MTRFANLVLVAYCVMCPTVAQATNPDGKTTDNPPMRIQLTPKFITNVINLPNIPQGMILTRPAGWRTGEGIPIPAFPIVPPESVPAKK